MNGNNRFPYVVACALALLSSAAYAQDVAVSHATVYTSPDEAPVRNGTVIIRGGNISEVGPAIPVPKDIPQVACDGCAVFAGFWNSHVHFTAPQLISKQPPNNRLRSSRQLCRQC